MNIGRFCLICSISLFLFSCSLEEDGITGLQESGTFPEILLEKSTYIISLEEGNPIVINGDRIEIYKEEQKAVIEEASFTQKDDDSRLTMEGSFKKAEVDTITNDVRMEDSVHLTMYPSLLSITGESLSFESEDRIVRSDGDSSITLTIEGEKSLRGTGFTGDLSRWTFEFEQLQEGVFTYE
ncbi:MAG: LPS export ABC transporter periplasmic protein LptC [Sphaerochaetaceae bacterium]|nr:LPS export ABC transporter periplasmic protein LptC [Sphaerochaetaceae bacterium]MDC7247652.1 LPS export ABC transporter periplasmic protein LptC [Sphaerochaetaceae bacterium]